MGRIRCAALPEHRALTLPTAQAPLSVSQVRPHPNDRAPETYGTQQAPFDVLE